MKILITGGAGYIGSHVTEQLIKIKKDVVVLDNLKTGYRSLINKKTRFIKGDVANIKLLKKIIEDNNISTIFHFAGLIDVVESEKHKSKYYKNNVKGTLSLIKAIKNSSVKNLIFSSTAGVYGNIKKAAKETMPTKPINYYALTKLKCELMIKKYSKIYNFNYAILRYFNVVGASQSKKIGPLNKNDTLFKNISTSIFKKNTDIKIYGNNFNTKDGTCIRDYIHVSDLSEIHIKILKKIEKVKKSVILNCGYGNGISVKQVVDRFIKISKRDANIIILNKRPADIISSIANNDNLKTFIKWKPKYNNLNFIINSCLAWEKNLSNNHH